MQSVERRLFGLSIPEPNSGCILWIGHTTPEGYGIIAMGKGKKAYAHRAAYEAQHGAIPHGLTIDHLCKTPSCINAAHLEAVTLRENMRRANLVDATHCRRGHPFSGPNLAHQRTRNGPQLLCRACRNARRKP